MIIWNPARELHQILERGLELSAESSTEAAWRDLLGASDLPELLLALDALTKLPDQVRATLAGVDEADRELLLSGLDQIEHTLVHQHLDAPWKQFNARIQALAVPRSNLRHAAQAIRREGLEVSIEENDLNDLRIDLANLMDSLQNSDLPDNLKRLLLQQLADVGSSLSKIAVFGPEYASANIDKVIGTLIRIDDVDDLPVEPLQRTAKWLKRATLVVSVIRLVLNVKGITTSLGDELPPWSFPPEIGGS